MASRKEVADLAGVSEATVSRVLNGVGPMKEETRLRVLEAAKQLDYQINAVAQSFALRRSGNLGVVVPFVPKVHLFSTYYFSEILSGIGETVRQKGYGLLLLFRNPQEEMDYVSLYRSHKVDACIVLGASDLPAETRGLKLLDAERLPFCVVNQRYEDMSVHEVDANHEEGSYAAVRHLLSQGMRRIAFLNGSMQFSNSRDRLAGYRRAMEEAGISIHPSHILEGNYSRTSGFQAASRIAELMGELDAVFAANDRMAIGLMQGLRELGIVPGRDLAVMGYDDSDAARMTDPSLSSVHVPFFDMGRLAAEQLLQRLSSDHAEEMFREKLQTHVVVRKSSIRATK